GKGDASLCGAVSKDLAFAWRRIHQRARRMRGRYSLSTWLWQAVICLAVLAIWQWGFSLRASVPWLIPDLLDPYFISRPSVLGCLKSKTGAFNGWWNGDFSRCMARYENNLWVATAVTLKNTFFGFLSGVLSGFVLGLALGRSDRLSAIF